MEEKATGGRRKARAPHDGKRAGKERRYGIRRVRRKHLRSHELQVKVVCSRERKTEPSSSAARVEEDSCERRGRRKRRKHDVDGVDKVHRPHRDRRRQGNRER